MLEWHRNTMERKAKTDLFVLSLVAFLSLSGCGVFDDDENENKPPFCQTDIDCLPGYQCRSFGCVPCEELCDSEEDRSECFDGILRYCNARNNCWYTMDCEFGFCSDEQTCYECADRCPSVHDTECSGGKIRSCQEDEFGCPNWTEFTDCASGVCLDERICE